MARKRTFLTNRWSGGMTDDTRNTNDLSKCARVSHLDIYRDPNQMYVIPGYVSDNAYDGSATGAKIFNFRALEYVPGTDVSIVAVGNKADGTGSRLFKKTSPTANEWELLGTAQGTDDLYAGTYLHLGSEYYYVTRAGGVNYISRNNTSAVVDKHVTLGSGIGNFVIEKTKNNLVYGTNGGASIDELTTSVSANAKTTAIVPRDIQDANDYIALFGNRAFPDTTGLLIWDQAGSLVDQNILFGAGVGIAIGFPSGNFVGVLSEGLTFQALTQTANEVNGRFAMSVKVATGNTVETLYRVYADDNTNSDIQPTRGKYHDTMLWYAKIPKDWGDYEGVWACGKGDINQPLGISILFDTSSLGQMRRVYNFGSHYFFLHDDDGSVSRLDNFETGVYDVPAIYETLVYGADTPFLKQFEGLSITTEDLPASASVQVEYRTDENSTWVSLGTSAITGRQKHNFTKANGVPIGKFQEIQFKLTFTGRIVVKSLTVAIVETDDLSFSV
jgi:hypothetical protein